MAKHDAPVAAAGALGSVVGTPIDAALVRGGKGEGVAARLPEAGDTWRIDASLEREQDGWKVVTARWRRIDAAEAEMPAVTWFAGDVRDTRRARPSTPRAGAAARRAGGRA